MLARYLYTVLLTLALPLVFARLLWRSLKAPAYRQRWAERLGWCDVSALDNRGTIWIHAVSVGESIAAAPMIHALLERYPGFVPVVTTTTPTGSQQVREMFGDQVLHMYMPYDLPGPLRRFMQRVHPSLVIVMETELWPNMLACCAQRGTPVLVANARLSEKSAHGYRRFSSLSRSMLQHVSVVAVQNAVDGERFVSLGLPAGRLSVTGSIKFDLTLSDDLRQQAAVLRSEWSNAQQRLVWLAASTHEGEDAILLEVYRELKAVIPSLLLVLVPRHPERFSRVAGLCTADGWRVVRRSSGAAVTAQDDILLGDTMGELTLFCGAADVVFVGGSLVPSGGHNLLEPAAWGVPVLTGPHLFNFTDVARLLEEGGGLLICENGSALREQLQRLLQDQHLRAGFGDCALQVVTQNRGALERLLGIIETLLTSNK